MQNWLKKARGYSQELAANQGLNALKLLGSVVLVAFFIYVLWPLPRTAVEHRIDKTHPLTLDKQLELEDDFRKTFAQIIGGFVILGGLFMSFKTFGLSREGHITDRFTKAIEQLGKTDGTTPNIEVRLGAIYALERIALDSPRDHWTIMEVLTAYVRQNAPLRPEVPYTEGEKPRTDIQAILTVLGRRKTGSHRERDTHRLDLSSSRLCGAYLERTRLQGASFNKANLREAALDQAELQKTWMSEANLQHASLWKTDLKEAELYKADLSRALICGANFSGASLIGTKLERANLFEANLQEVVAATPEQIQTAINWQFAHYSPAFRVELGLTPEHRHDTPIP